MAFERPLSVEEICNKLRPVFGKKIDEIYFQYTVADTREEREEIVHVLNALYQKHLNQLLDKGVLLEPPREEVIDGTYNLGTISYARRKLFDFTLREQDWPRHMCVTGMSGSGKTTFAFKVIESLNEHKKNFLVFDWKKSFRPLLATNQSIVLFTVGDDRVSNLFKTNINQPPRGVPPKEWINVLSDLLTESFSASFGVHKVILETLDEAFKEWGIYNGSENYPTWNHIKWRLEEKLEKIQGREAGWLESALRIATVMTFGEFGKTLNYKGNNSISVDELLDKKVIMELNALGNIEKKFFCEFVLTYIYKLKKARQNNAGNHFDHAIIVDEAHNIFLKKPTTFSNESVTDMIYREMREYGTALVCLDQHISKISDTVKGNSACHIAFQQQLPQDIQDISDIMQLREHRHYFSSLPVGNAIVKLSERYNNPFLVEIPYSQTRNNAITDEDIKARVQTMVLAKEYTEKKDLKFNQQVENPKPVIKEEPKVIERPIVVEEPKVKIKEEIEIREIVEEKVESKKELTKIQKVVYNFMQGYLSKGIKLQKIESILEDSKKQGSYTSEDIKAAKEKIKEELEPQKIIEKEKPVVEKPKVIEKKTEVVKEKPKVYVKNSKVEKDEDAIIEFLKENPKHTLSTVEVYKSVGLSARKGTNAKKSLEEKGLIMIKEVKYDKGWKKIIRLPDQD